MKELWEIEMLHSRTDYASLQKFADENGLVLEGEDLFAVSYLALYEFVADISELTPAQILDFQNLLYAVNYNDDALVSGVILYEDDFDGDNFIGKIDSNDMHFVYRSWLSDDEFDEIFSIFLDYNRVGAPFEYMKVKSRKVLTEVF